MKSFATNTRVKWQWGNGDGAGKVREVRHETFTRKIKDTEVTRHGTEENPAYLIEMNDGDKVIKLHSELEKAS